MSDLYPLGQPVRLSTTVADLAGVPADPTALTLAVVFAADGTAVTKHWPTPADITRDSTGAFHYDTTPAAAGHYAYTWTATGNNAGVDADVYDVFDPATYRRLVSYADAKAFLRITTTTADAALLDRIVGWASARIIREVEAIRQSVTQVVTAVRGGLTLSRTPVRAVTAITAVSPWSPTVDATSAYVTSELGGTVEFTGTRPAGTYSVTYVAGYDAIPPGVDGACLALIRHWWDQAQAHASATYGPDGGGFVPDFKGLPNLVENMLAAAPPKVWGFA